MSSQGALGFIIGRKKRMMRVTHDADLLWQILVREIYVLMKHYGSKELLIEAFGKIKPVPKSPPKHTTIDKYRIFTDLSDYEEVNLEWCSLLEYCQSSYINLIESGYIVNQPDAVGYVVMLDLNKCILSYYMKDLSGKTKELLTASMDEIMEFSEMPTQTYGQIVSEMRDRFAIFNDKLVKIETEINKLKIIIDNAHKECSHNIEDKAKRLLYDINIERNQLNMTRRVFYYRLKALDMIEDDT
tara:strand:- start:14 stop:742 length:729 start_codon:yes stop_codon:yes gene_type:complete